MTLEARCVNCAYPLRGLSAPGRCPECGEPFDAHTRAWRRRLPWQLVTALTVMAIYLLLLALTLLNGSRMLSLPPVFYLAVALYSVVAFVRLYGRWGRSAWLVAATPRGLLIRQGRSEHLVPWADFNGVTHLGRVVEVQRKSDAALAIPFMFRRIDDIESFRLHVESAAAAHARTEPAVNAAAATDAGA